MRCEASRVGLGMPGAGGRGGVNTPTPGHGVEGRPLVIGPASGLKGTTALKVGAGPGVARSVATRRTTHGRCVITTSRIITSRIAIGRPDGLSVASLGPAGGPSSAGGIRLSVRPTRLASEALRGRVGVTFVTSITGVTSTPTVAFTLILKARGPTGGCLFGVTSAEEPPSVAAVSAFVLLAFA